MRALLLAMRPFRSIAIRRLAWYLPLPLFPLLLLWRVLFAGQVFFWGTPLLQFVPWQRLAAEMWRSGYLPLWNSLVGCGAPLAANYQTAAFYPLNGLALILPAEVALSWTTALHVVLAGLGMYAWLRTLRLDRFPALLGALAFQGSGFLAARLALFPSMAFTFPWLPIWLWRTERLVQQPRASNGLFLGLVLGLGLLAGHAQTAAYGCVLVAAYWAFRVLLSARQFGLFAGSLLVGLSLAAVQLLPTAELTVLSQRSGGLAYDSAMTYSFWPWRLITLAAPDFFGNPGHGDYWGYGNYWEDAGYVGLLPLLLALGAVLKRGAGGDGQSRAVGQRWFWLGTAVVALVLSLGRNTPVFPFLFRHLPGFDLFQAPARWLAVYTVAVATLCGFGAQAWLCERPNPRRGLPLAVLGGAALLGGLVALWLMPAIPATFARATVRFGATLALAGGLLRFARSKHSVAWREAVWRGAVLGFLALDLLWFGWPLLPSTGREIYAHAHPVVDLPAGGQPARVYWPTDPASQNRDYDAEYRIKFDYLRFDGFGPPSSAHWLALREMLLPNAGVLDGVASANNFDPLLAGRYVDWLAAMVGDPAANLLRAGGVTHVARVGENGRVTFEPLPGSLGRAWIVPAARVAPAGEVLAVLADPAFDPAAEVVLEVPPVHQPVRQGTPSTSQPALTLRDASNRTTIHATLDRPGYLVLADTWYPGWRASVDGVPVELLRANHTFRAVWLEAGEHVVEMVYRPASVLTGGSLSLAALAFLMLAWLIVSKREGRA